jgi:hypothetical protein
MTPTERDIEALIIRARDLDGLAAIERARGPEMTPYLVRMMADRVAMLKARDKRPDRF